MRLAFIATAIELKQLKKPNLSEVSMTLHSFSGTLFAASMPGLLVTPTLTAQETQPPYWSYSGADNPKLWGKLDPAYSACSLGRTQSPIDVTMPNPPIFRSSCPEVRLPSCAVEHHRRRAYRSSELRPRQPGRTAMRWHIGNFPKDVLGCCVVGAAVGENLVANSKGRLWRSHGKASGPGHNRRVSRSSTASR
jgi:hypothetical protein